MKWEFCQCCFLDGHCENQDRDHKCETYPKQLEDKVEHLQEQLADSSKTIERLKDRLDNAHRTLCEVLRMSLSDEKDISKIYDIVNPTLEKLNQPLTQYKQSD